ncbi:MAG: hypothetical protein HQK96_07520 [Nitrospirae bacterium]|nr:hypothetical protein [Nitrospirota bacterium]
MALWHKRFQNKKTGEIMNIPAGRYGNFRMAAKKIVQYTKYNMDRFYVVHLVLTVAENVSDVDMSNFHRVANFINQRLKRVGSDFKYIAVKELQSRGAIHFHVLCIYTKKYSFPDSGDIQKSWKLGFVKITTPGLMPKYGRFRIRVEKIIAYLGKYIGKGYEYEELEAKKSFTASQIKQIYKLSDKRLNVVMETFGKEQAETFTCTYTRVYEEVKIEPFRRKKLCVLAFDSDWKFIGNEEEPF